MLMLKLALFMKNYNLRVMQSAKNGNMFFANGATNVVVLCN